MVYPGVFREITAYRIHGDNILWIIVFNVL